MGSCLSPNEKKEFTKNKEPKNKVKNKQVDIKKPNIQTIPNIQNIPNIPTIPKSDGWLSILANYQSKKPNLIFELSDDDFQNNMVDNILDKSKKNDFLVIYKNLKSKDLNSFNNNELETKFSQINNKNLKTVYIYWISLEENIDKSILNIKQEYYNLNNKLLIGISINSIDNIDVNIKQVKQIHNTLKRNNLQLAVIKAHFSLLFREYEDLVKYCKNNNILFFADVFMEHGALSGKYGSNNLMDNENRVGMFFNSQIYKIDNINKVLGDLAKQYNTNILKIPIIWGFSYGIFPIININEIQNIEDIDNSVSNINFVNEEITMLERDINAQYLDIKNIN